MNNEYYNHRVTANPPTKQKNSVFDLECSTNKRQDSVKIELVVFLYELCFLSRYNRRRPI